MKKLKHILTGLLLLMAFAASAQNITVTGVVKDSSTGEPVPFASIRLDGTMTGGTQYLLRIVLIHSHISGIQNM